MYLKRLALRNINNCRDLGGLNLPGESFTNYGVFLRSANLDEIDNVDLLRLKNYNVTTIIDLRKDSEIPKNSKQYKIIRQNFEYNNLSLQKDIITNEMIDDLVDGKLTIGETYYGLLENKSIIKEIFDVFYKAKGCVLFHCQEGKDRTGIIAMLLLMLAGAEENDIYADYEISSAYLGYIRDYSCDDPMNVFRITSPFYIKTANDYIKEKYENVEKYLSSCGIDKKVIYAIKERLVGI